MAWRKRGHANLSPPVSDPSEAHQTAFREPSKALVPPLQTHRNKASRLPRSDHRGLREVAVVAGEPHESAIRWTGQSVRHGPRAEHLNVRSPKGPPQDSPDQ